jgi:hypothetical protein
MSQKKQGELKWVHPSSFLAVQAVNPSHCFDIVDFPQVTLCGCKVRVPEDYFANDFNGHPGAAGISCRMSPEVMGFEGNVDQVAGLSDRDSCSFVINGKYPVIKSLADLYGIVAQSLGSLFGNKDILVLFAAFGVADHQLAILDVFRSQ